jgi:hypothetical protein
VIGDWSNRQKILCSQTLFSRREWIRISSLIPTVATHPPYPGKMGMRIEETARALDLVEEHVRLSVFAFYIVACKGL